VKAAVPELAALAPTVAAARLRRILTVARRVGLVGTVRPVEQTPELAHIVDVVRLAYPQARVVHILRDGRDAACSLLEKPWVRHQEGSDDAGVPYGAYARFWVEPERRQEFEEASGARRAAWVWRRYVEAARGSGSDLVTIRYEDLATGPERVANRLAEELDAPRGPLLAALRRAHAGSVGRYRTDLSADQLADVEAEAGDLLRELGYLT
jgi:hypothetical protein